MIIEQIQDVKKIIPIHNEIFGKDFPIESYYKKCKKNELYIYVYKDEGKILGYSIVVDQAESKNLYAWYGGVLPMAQGNGITDLFFEKLIDFARLIQYNSITFASYNTRPHMLRYAIKKGFDIYDIKKRNYGSGDKIYFIYKLHPSSELHIDFMNDGRMVKPAEIEEKLVLAYKSNCKKFYFNAYCNYETLEYAVKYCNSFLNKPEIIIITDEKLKNKIDSLMVIYSGKITIE